MSDAGPYQITFNNYSSVDFTLSRLDHDLPSSAAWVTKPEQTLNSSDGSQTAAVSETSTIIITDFAVIWLGSGFRFGVRMHIPGQWIPPTGPVIGTAPYYYVGQDTDTSANPPTFNTWTEMDPASPYTWTDNVGGLSIQATTTAGKSSLEITVIITDAQ